MYNKKKHPYRACLHDCQLMILAILMQITLLIFALSTNTIIISVAYFVFLTTVLMLFNRLVILSESILK